MDLNYILKWILGIVGVLTTALIIYIVKLLAGKADSTYITEMLKADKQYVDEKFTAIRFDMNAKFVSAEKDMESQISKLSITYKEDKKYLFDLIIAHKLLLDSTIIVVQKFDGLLGRETDKSIVVNQSVTDLKTDMKQLVVEIQKLSKELDALPMRVSNLEQSERDKDRKA